MGEIAEGEVGRGEILSTLHKFGVGSAWCRRDGFVHSFTMTPGNPRIHSYL